MAARKKTVPGPVGPVGTEEQATAAMTTGATGGAIDKTKKDKNKKTTDKNKKGDKTTKQVLSLEESVKKFYPQYYYLLENPDLFGRDVINVLRQAVDKEWPVDRFTSSLSRTNYYQNTVAAAKNFDMMPEADKRTAIDRTKLELRSYTDTSTIDDATLDTFARDMARRGVSGEALRPLAYKFVFDQGAATKAAQEAYQSQTAQAIRQTAASYGQKVDDSQLQTLLENGETAESFQRKAVAKLKAQYPQLRDQLDAGLTFSDITSDYKRIASSVLEKPAESIDFMDPKYMDAIAQPDGKGGYRQLSLGEWQQKLRTDDRYGYAKTSQAIQDARSLAASIARSFGKVM